MSDNVKNVLYEVSEISEDQIDKIKKKSVHSLPDSPAAHGMKAGIVKPKFWYPLVQGKDSIVGYINALIVTLNEIFGDVESKQKSAVKGFEFDETESSLFAIFGDEGKKKILGLDSITPVREEDYCTEEDKEYILEELEAYVLKTFVEGES